jgi:hypothetical protein
MLYEQMPTGPELLQRSAFVGEVVGQRPQVVVDDPQLTAVQPSGRVVDVERRRVSILRREQVAETLVGNPEQWVANSQRLRHR